MKPSFTNLFVAFFGVILLSGTCAPWAAFFPQPTATPTKTPRPHALKATTATATVVAINLPATATATNTTTPTQTASPLPPMEPPTATPLPAELSATSTSSSSIAAESTTATPAEMLSDTPSPTVAPTDTPPPAISGNSSKKGLAAPPGSANCGDLGTLGAAWYYNWTVRGDAGCEGNPAFVPRLWGPPNMSELPVAIESARASGWLIGFNEPNLPGAGFITPEDGARLWKQVENAALPQGIKLVSPAPNPYQPNHEPGDKYGYTWLMAMVKAYQAQNQGALPHFDALGWHTYHPDPEVNKNYLSARRNEFKDLYPGAKMWILEYNGCFVKNDPERVMREVTPWLEQQDWVARYAWYVSRPDANPHSDGPCTLINRDGNVRDIGKLYQSLY